MANVIYPVILMGGKGARLWPLSRPALPKPFLKIFSDLSLFQETLKRVQNTLLFSTPIIVGHVDHESYIHQQLAELNMRDSVIILEPCGRNTTPALTLAALYLKAKDPTAFMLTLPSDHWLESREEFERTIQRCQKFLQTQDVMVNLTVHAHEVNLNYGHILRGRLMDQLLNIFKVETFLEKPTKGQFTKFEEEGMPYWNTGIFITRPQTLLAEISQLDRTTYDLCTRSMKKAQVVDQRIYPLLEDCLLLQEAAIDDTVMMHSQKLYTTQLNCHWSDVGTWAAASKIFTEDERGNVQVGRCDIVDSDHCFAFSNKPRLCLIGVKDLIIVSTEDAILVMAKNQDRQLKSVVEEGSKNQIKEFCETPEQFRPWGSFRILNRGEAFQIKELNVLPYKQLSLQSHQHRSERWTVLSGQAEVTLNQEIHLLNEQETIFIPQMAHHRLKNPTKNPLKLLEIQFGNPILESDITRYEDDFYRT